MYLIFLSLHNILRWVVLIAGLIAVARALMGWLGRREWTRADRLSGLLFGISIDIQLLLGLILYFFLSPWTQAVLRGNLGQAMQNSETRFFAIDHILVMFLAVVSVHFGTALARRAPEAVTKHRRAAIWFGLTLILILAGIPWWRPLLPLFG